MPSTRVQKNRNFFVNTLRHLLYILLESYCQNHHPPLGLLVSTWTPVSIITGVHVDARLKNNGFTAPLPFSSQKPTAAVKMSIRKSRMLCSSSTSKREARMMPTEEADNSDSTVPYPDQPESKEPDTAHGASPLTKRRLTMATLSRHHPSKTPSRPSYKRRKYYTASSHKKPPQLPVTPLFFREHFSAYALPTCPQFSNFQARSIYKASFDSEILAAFVRVNNFSCITMLIWSLHEALQNKTSHILKSWIIQIALPMIHNSFTSGENRPKEKVLGRISSLLLLMLPQASKPFEKSREQLLLFTSVIIEASPSSVSPPGKPTTPKPSAPSVSKSTGESQGQERPIIA